MALCLFYEPYICLHFHLLLIFFMVLKQGLFAMRGMKHIEFWEGAQLLHSLTLLEIPREKLEMYTKLWFFILRPNQPPN